MKAHRTALLWFRRDLRLTDNSALLNALEQADRVVPVFVFAPEEEARWAPGAASRWWLHHSLMAVQAELRKRGSRLIVQRGPSLTALQRTLRETAATLVCWNKLYEPAALKRDAEIAAALDRQDIAVEQCNSSLLFEPSAILNGQQ